MMLFFFVAGWLLSSLSPLLRCSSLVPVPPLGRSTNLGRRCSFVVTRETHAAAPVFDWDPSPPEAISLLGDDREAVFAAEEAMEKARRPPATREEEVDATWDASFWRELGEVGHPRADQFFRAHRAMSLGTVGRNRTELSLRRGDDNQHQDQDQDQGGKLEEDVFFAYPGLDRSVFFAPQGGASSPQQPWPFVGGLLEAALTAAPSLVEEMRDDYEGRRAMALYPPEAATAEGRKRRELITHLRKTEKERFKTSSGQFDVLENYGEEDQQEGDKDKDQDDEPRSTDASIEASFASFDDFDDGPADTTAEDDLFGDFDDDLFATEASESDFSSDFFSDDDDDDEEDLDEERFSSSSFQSQRRTTTTRGKGGDFFSSSATTQQRKKRKNLILLSSYFRHDPLAEKTFPELLAHLPPSPRRAAALLLRPGERPPLASRQAAYLLTCYLRLRGDPQHAGVRRHDDRLTDDVVLVAANAPQAPFNDGQDDALFLVFDYWHPDLDPDEVDALERFLRLDEQFALRRYPPHDILPVLLDTERPLSSF